ADAALRGMAGGPAQAACGARRRRLAPYSGRTRLAMLGSGCEKPFSHAILPSKPPMIHHRRCAHHTFTLPAVGLALTLVCGTASAQDRQGGFLDNLFNPGQQRQQPDRQDAPRAAPRIAQSDGGGGEDSARIDRIESALRQLTGTIEQLQHDNQMLQMQLKRMQDDTEYRFQQMGSRGGAAPMPPAAAAPGPAPIAPTGPAPQPGRRSDVFDPSQQPNAPGAPRTLGGATASAAPNNPPIMNEQPVGAPGGRDAGAPLDLSPLAANPPAAVPNGEPAAAPAGIPAPQTGQLPPVMAPRGAAAGTQLATLPPSASPKDEYDLAYGYVLRKDYALASQAFEDFMAKYPNDKLLPNAQYWLGESQFQQQRYREAAESFLAVSTKYAHSGKAPEALLRLGQSRGAASEGGGLRHARRGRTQISEGLAAGEARRRPGTEAWPLLRHRRSRSRKPGSFFPVSSNSRAGARRLGRAGLDRAAVACGALAQGAQERPEARRHHRRSRPAQGGQARGRRRRQAGAQARRCAPHAALERQQACGRPAAGGARRALQIAERGGAQAQGRPRPHRAHARRPGRDRADPHEPRQRPARARRHAAAVAPQWRRAGFAARAPVHRHPQ